MKLDGFVRLKRPFSPHPTSIQTYCLGIIAGVFPTEASTEILLYLYDPENSKIYTDEFDSQAIYSFQLDEVEAYSDRQQESGY